MGLTAEQRAEIAAQSQKSAELEGGSLTPATKRDTAAYVAGDSAAQELQRRVRVRHGLLSKDESEGTTTHTLIDAACAHAAGQLDDDVFIALAVGLPIVRQNPQPATPFWDTWILIDGPVSDVQAAFSQGLISAELYDSCVAAMASAGREA